MLKNTKSIGLLSAVFIGVSSMIGSGWLYAPLNAAKIAGPAAIYSWIIGAVVVAALAMLFSEIVSIFPRRGLSSIIVTLSHNKYFGFPFAIANWLGIVAVISLEATASVEYLIHIVPEWEAHLFVKDNFTMLGTSVVIFFILIYALLNFWGAKVLVKANNAIVFFKLLIPVATAILLLLTVYNPDNFIVVNNSFVPYGMSSIMTAVLAGGIVVTFNGFQAIVSFASEVKEPHKTIPLSILISVSFTLIIYLLLQVAFIGAVPSADMAGGYRVLNYEAPMVQLTALAGLNFMSLILYTDAIVSPMGTAITFTGASTRMFTAMARNQQMPKYFDKVDPKIKISRRSLFANIALAIFFVFAFTNWQKLAEMLGILHIISYLGIPLAFVVMRDKIDKTRYPFRAPAGQAIAVLLFLVFTYMVTRATSVTLLEVVTSMAIFQVIFVLLNASSKMALKEGFTHSVPLFVFFFVLVLLNEYTHDSNTWFGIGMIALISFIAFKIFTKLHINPNLLEDLKMK